MGKRIYATRTPGAVPSAEPEPVEALDPPLAVESDEPVEAQAAQADTPTEVAVEALDPPVAGVKSPTLTADGWLVPDGFGAARGG